MTAKITSLVAGSAAGSAMLAAVPLTAKDVAALQKEAEDDRAIYESLTCADDAEYELADALLSELCRREAAATAMCQSATGPLYKVIKTVEGWFRPYKSELEFAKKSCKNVMGAYRVKQDADARAARELAASAAETGDADALVEALETAQAAEQKPAGRATCGFQWVLKRVVPDLVMRDWLVPDEARARAHAAATAGDAEIVAVPGFVFEKVARIGGKK